MSVISYYHPLFAIDNIAKILIYKNIINDKIHNLNKEFICTLFTFLHSANFNNTRTAALQGVTVKDNNIARDCFKEDC
jgi:hypothetical protein